MTKLLIKVLFILLISSTSACAKKHTENIDLALLAGHWFSKEYGFQLNVHDGLVEVFDIAGPYCLKNRDASETFLDYFKFANKVDDNTLIIATVEGATHYRFLRLEDSVAESRIATCFTEAIGSPTRNFDYFVQLMGEFYAFFDLYGVNWSERVSTYRGSVREEMTEQELATLMDSMLIGIEDAHLFIAASIDGKRRLLKRGHSRVLRPALDRAYTEQQKIRDGKKFRLKWFKHYKKHLKKTLFKGEKLHNHEDLIFWGMRGDVGYINITRMIGYSDEISIASEVKEVKKVMRKVIADLKYARSIFIDVTANGGGDDEVSRAIAGFFTDKPVTGFEKQVFGNPAIRQQFLIEPHQSMPYLGPVVLITSDHTVSGAEVFTMMMKALPNVRHVGDTTRGALSDVLDKTLPNGWKVGLSNEIYLDTNSKSYESKGISPERVVPIFAGNNIYTSHVEAISKIIEIASKWKFQ